ncbi:hypothetical protein [Mangrovibacterium marinum]|uniref:Type IX secretion system PorP/SprF family membrane protein n=1 Tax=Mangrovibacterium marinum TaxID=1639118 RepID=A0A2T5BYB3_9BACT|nr:hypothetical protein [Mangrovibacterium marinum]PTN07225.1 hypothetical protein C8N47_12010 [Mangrovibacterium marinum]
MKIYSIPKLSCLLVFSLVCWSATAQNTFVVPAAMQALGNSGVSFDRADGYVLNPAAAAHSSLTAGATYSNRYLLKDLSAGSVFAILPIAGSRLLGSYGQYGNDSYQENLVQLGLSKTLGEKLSAGLLFHYLSFRMAESDSRPAMFTFSAGVQYQLNNGGLGASVFNLYSFSGSSGDYQADYPCCVRLGGHQLWQNKLLFAAQLSYHEEYGLCSHWGLGYNLLKQLVLRAGLQTGQPEWSFGLGFLFGRINADLSFSHHQYLGFSPSFTFYFQRP